MYKDPIHSLFNIAKDEYGFVSDPRIVVCDKEQQLRQFTK